MTDIYCDVIDNYGDIAFAIKVMNTYYFENKESEFRFFSNAQNIFSLFEKNILPGISCQYYELSEISSRAPSSLILNFFERPIDYRFLEGFDFAIHLISFSYFSLEDYSSPLSPGIAAYHGKIFQHKNLTVEQFSVSLLANTGGVFPEKKYFPKLLSKKYFIEKYSLPKDKKWISVFCYPDTLEHLYQQSFFTAGSDQLIFLLFGSEKQASENTIVLPFLSMQEYASLLEHCRGNIVRGENSLISALEANRDFFWDIYKEKNNAHEAKLDDFAAYLGSKGYKKKLIDAQIIGNKEQKYESVKKLFVEDSEIFES